MLSWKTKLFLDRGKSWQLFFFYRHSASQKIHKFKEQLNQTKALHKAEVEELNHKVWESNRTAQKYNIEVSIKQEGGQQNSKVW